MMTIIGCGRTVSLMLEAARLRGVAIDRLQDPQVDLGLADSLRVELPLLSALRIMRNLWHREAHAQEVMSGTLRGSKLRVHSMISKSGRT